MMIDTLREACWNKWVKDCFEDFKVTACGFHHKKDVLVTAVQWNDQFSWKHSRTCQNHSIFSNFKNFIFKHLFKESIIKKYRRERKYTLRVFKIPTSSWQKNPGTNTVEMSEKRIPVKENKSSSSNFEKQYLISVQYQLQKLIRYLSWNCDL